MGHIEHERINTFTPNVIKKAQEHKPWVRKRGDKYRVIPRTSDHGKYELTVAYDHGFPIVESCVDYRTGEPCLGFSYTKQCYHAARLLIHLLSKKSLEG